MSKHLSLLAATAMMAALLLTAPASAQPPPVPDLDRDSAPGEVPPLPTEPEPLTRGPVHEGFAQPGTAPVPGTALEKEPPPPIEEAPPDQRPEGAGVVWLPGYWMWDDVRSDFVWVSGSWRASPPGRKFVPGYWAKTDAGWVWVSGLWVPATAVDMPYADEPPASLERGPALPPPDEDSIYVPGIWTRRDDRFLWRAGFWTPGKRGWVYTPPRWVWTPRGYLFVGGFWDRPLEDRGLLFAPVYIPRSLYARPGFVHRPSLVVGVGPLVGSLWVRPGFGGYAFGDYYDRRGYEPWALYGPRSRDALFGYYRFANRSNPAWERGLVSTYRGRLAGDIARPPTTYAAQRAGRPGVAVVSPLGRSSARLTTATVAERERAASYRRAATERRDIEARRTARAGAALPLRDPGPRIGVPLERPRPAPGPRIGVPLERPRPRIETPRIETPRIETPRPRPVETPRTLPPRGGPPAPRIAPTPGPRIETPRIETPRPRPVETPRPLPPRVAPAPAPRPVETPRRLETPRSRPVETPRTLPPRGGPPAPGGPPPALRDGPRRDR